MFLIFDDRPSDSPFVERIWRCHSEHAGTFLSIAANHWEMVVTRHKGKTTLTVRGPETNAATLDCPAEGEWLGIRFKLGTFMPQLPARNLLDRKDVILPQATDHSFWLNGSAWEYPDFENAETFVKRLVHDGLIAVDLPVDAASARSTARTVNTIRTAAFSANNGDDPKHHSPNRTRPPCDEPLEAGRFNSRHGLRSRLFRSSASHPIAQTLHRTNTCTNYSCG